MPETSTQTQPENLPPFSAELLAFHLSPSTLLAISTDLSDFCDNTASDAFLPDPADSSPWLRYCQACVLLGEVQKALSQFCESV